MADSAPKELVPSLKQFEVSSKTLETKFLTSFNLTCLFQAAFRSLGALLIFVIFIFVHSFNSIHTEVSILGGTIIFFKLSKH